MATITLTSIYAQLNDWTGPLLEAPDGTTIVTRSATSFVYRLPATIGEFANFRVQVTGTGFVYDRGEPIAGRMTQVRILNDLGQTVLTFANLGSNALANDLSQFYASVFGTRENDGEGVSSNLMAAWSHLMAGNDTITGTSGGDYRSLVGFDVGNDVYNMLAGDDYIEGGLGNDTIRGGDGYDIMSYAETNYGLGPVMIRGVTVNAQTGVVLDPWGGRDVVTGIEEFRGSRLNDSFVGNDIDRDRFMGGRGRDTMDGGANSFTSLGAVDPDRRDEVRYDRDLDLGGRRGIVVDLETSFANGSIRGTIRDGFGNLDTVIDIERVIGTRFNDVFVGSRMNNQFSGGEGVDRYTGGAGFDTVSFDRYFGITGPTAGVRVNLALATGQVLNDGFGNTETAVGIEAIRGTDRADSIRGGAEENEFYLALGQDTMTGGGGSDYFVWESRSEFGQGDVVTDFTANGLTADKIAFWTPGITGMTTTLELVNGTAATSAQATFVFNAANDTLYWDPDGTGATAALAVVRLTNVASLSAANFDLWT